MKSRLPNFLNKYKVCIICEGDEEYNYLNRLNELKVWNEQYAVDLDNADGNGNIPARYQNRYQNGSYDIVFVFCDTDKKPYEQYIDIKRKINEFHGVSKAANEVVIYGNPCTMQIILEHWTDVRLKSPAKKVNAFLIEELTGVENYKGRADQRIEIMKQITVDNFRDMCKRIKQMQDNDSIVGSSNFGKLMDYLMKEDYDWIREINSILEE